MAFNLHSSGRPGFNASTFSSAPFGIGSSPMTIGGTVNKAFLLLVVLLFAALWPWVQASAGNLHGVTSGILIGLIGGFVLALTVSFKPSSSRYLAIPYAALEGLALGGVSSIIDQRYPGIALQAVSATFAVMGVMLLAYKAGFIHVTNRFRAIVIGATGGIALLYLASFILGFFHVGVPLLSSSSSFGIGFSLLVVAVAALNLALDFDLIAQGVAHGAPEYMEWYGAFSLMVTLVWMYLEILRLLVKLKER